MDSVIPRSVRQEKYDDEYGLEQDWVDWVAISVPHVSELREDKIKPYY